MGQHLPEVVQIESLLTRWNLGSFISVSFHHAAVRRFWITSSKNRVWLRLRVLWSYNELGLTNHSIFFKGGCFINSHKARCSNQRERALYWNFIIERDKTSRAEIVRMTSVLTRLSQSEAELIYFSLPSRYTVKTVFDHFPTYLFFSFTFYVKIQIVSFHQLISFSFIPSCPSFSKLPCGVGIDKTSTTPSYDSI